MIVRILGEGQFLVEDADLDNLKQFDDALEAAVTAGDDDALHSCLTTMLDHVREAGTPVDADLLIDSDVILPDAGVSLDQLREWLDSDDSFGGLVP